MTTIQQAGAAGRAAALPGPVPSPAELLPLLSTWMANAGFGEEHPWQVAIAQTLAEPVAAGDAARAQGEGQDAVFCAIASQTRDLMRLVDDLDADGDFRHAAVLRHLLGRVGWLADLGLSRFGTWTPAGVDGGEWFLTAYQAKLLGLKGGTE